VDVGLHDLYDPTSGILPEWAQNPSTFAALLPNVFVALVPRGGYDYLQRLEDLPRQAQTEMERRWQELSGIVRFGHTLVGLGPAFEESNP
jgi:hypothetical protein